MTIRASDHLPHDLTEEQYRRLPETAAREIEVVHGHVIIRESPVPEHNRVARRLAGSMEELPSTEPWIRVETDIDVVLWPIPKFTFRRPDVTVYRCLPERGAKPEAGDALIVVEVSSPSTAAEDLLDKKVQYARAGIPLYLVVVLDQVRYRRGAGIPTRRPRRRISPAPAAPRRIRPLGARGARRHQLRRLGSVAAGSFRCLANPP
ncbi:Uma2 family endonuclease [Nocardia beijingensis]